MVVEDDEDSADSLAMLLRLNGHDVLLATDALSAVEAARAHDLDVVLLDIGLPGTDGLHVARWFEDHPAAKKPLLVAITGYGMDEDRVRSRKAGIDLHLVKPVDPRQLMALLKRFCQIIA